MTQSMFRRFRVLCALGAVLGLAACAQPPAPKDYSTFRAVNPRSIAVVPAINRSVNVNAQDYYLATISRPLAARGYYVFPVHLLKRMMEDQGLADADMVAKGDPKVLGGLLGADSILYVTIERWDSQYLVISTTTTVELSYVLKSTATGKELWREHRIVVYQPNNGGGGGVAGLIAQAVVAAIEKADPNYMPLARQANAIAVSQQHQGLPAGPYVEAYRKDGADF